MNKPPKPPPPPSFEPPSDYPLGDLTEEDLAWVDQEIREGRLVDMTPEEMIAQVEAHRKRIYDRFRRAGLDPDAKDNKPEE
jgi:hypothetical protein